MTGAVFIHFVWTITLYTLISPVSSQNASVTTAAPPSSPSLCPTIPVRQESRTLTFFVIPNKCELVVRVRVVMRNTKYIKSLSFLKRRGVNVNQNRNLYLPEVEMVQLETAASDTMTTEAPVTCPDYRIRNFGLLTVIDIERNVCQLVVGVQRVNLNTQSTRARDRFDFLPVFQYIEEELFR